MQVVSGVYPGLSGGDGEIEEDFVNRLEMKGNWTQLKGRARETWGRLTNDDLDQIAGRRQVLIGRIQERYGKDLASAEEEVDTWLDRMDGNGGL